MSFNERHCHLFVMWRESFSHQVTTTTTKFSSSRSDPSSGNVLGKKMCWCRLLASNNGNTQTDSLLPTRAFSLLLKGSQEGVPAPPWSREVQQKTANVHHRLHSGEGNLVTVGAAGLGRPECVKDTQSATRWRWREESRLLQSRTAPPRGKRNPNRETQQRRNAEQHGKWGAGELMRLMEGGGRGRKKEKEEMIKIKPTEHKSKTFQWGV